MRSNEQSLSQWSDYEARTIQEEGQQQKKEKRARTSKGRSTENYKTYPHVFFNIYGTLAGLSSILLCVAQFIGFTIEDMPEDINQVKQYCIAIYLIVMCFLSLLNELEWCTFIFNSKILSFWISRGLLYAFMGFLSLYQLHEGSEKSPNQTTFIQGISYVFFGIGVGYTIMGLLCLQVVYERIRSDYEARSYNRASTANATNSVGTEKDRDLVLEVDGKEFA